MSCELTWVQGRPHNHFCGMQVSHHPPVACLHGSGPGYQLHGELMLVASFWGKAITVKSAGGFEATLQVPESAGHDSPRHKAALVAEQYWWTKPTVTINNIIIGKLWSEPTGTLTISCSNGAAHFLPNVSLTVCAMYLVQFLLMTTSHRRAMQSLGRSVRVGPLATKTEALCSCLSLQSVVVSEHTTNSAAFCTGSGRCDFGRFSHRSRELSVCAIMIDLPAGCKAELQYERCKGNLDARGRIYGSVSDAHGAVQYDVSGSIMRSVSATPRTTAAAAALQAHEGGAVTVFERPKDVPDADKLFHLSRFAIALNDELDAARAARTDSRLRPDVRCLENAQYGLATEEKLRLEEKQRGAAKERAAAGSTFAPRWFERRDGRADDVAENMVKGRLDAQPTWQYNGKYWPARERQEWGDLPDIYSGGPSVSST